MSDAPFPMLWPSEDLGPGSPGNCSSPPATDGSGNRGARESGFAGARVLGPPLGLASRPRAARGGLPLPGAPASEPPVCGGQQRAALVLLLKGKSLPRFASRAPAPAAWSSVRSALRWASKLTPQLGPTLAAVVAIHGPAPNRRALRALSVPEGIRPSRKNGPRPYGCGGAARAFAACLASLGFPRSTKAVAAGLEATRPAPRLGAESPMARHTEAAAQLAPAGWLGVRSALAAHQAGRALSSALGDFERPLSGGRQVAEEGRGATD